jgi:hypothetical protein
MDFDFAFELNIKEDRKGNDASLVVVAKAAQ